MLSSENRILFTIYWRREKIVCCPLKTGEYHLLPFNEDKRISFLLVTENRKNNLLQSTEDRKFFVVICWKHEKIVFLLHENRRISFIAILTEYRRISFLLFTENRKNGICCNLLKTQGYYLLISTEDRRITFVIYWRHKNIIC